MKKPRTRLNKVVINQQDGTCHGCGRVGQIALVLPVQPICMVCGSLDIRDPRGHAFEPMFGPARTYRASRYTPELPDRRVNNRMWPKAKERRAQGATA